MHSDNSHGTPKFIVAVAALLLGVLIGGVFVSHSDLQSANSNLSSIDSNLGSIDSDLGSIDSDLQIASQPVPGDSASAVTPQLRACMLPEHSRP